MGWQTQSVVQLFAGNTVINPNGIFVYNGVPGPGNQPIATITTKTSDPFGNPVQTGITSYGNANLWAQLLSGILTLNTIAGQAQSSTISQQGTADLLISTGSVSGGTQALLELQASDSAGGAGTAKAIIQAGAVTMTATSVTITGTLSVNGSTNTAVPVPNATSTNGLPDGTIHGTSGPASTGTAHTHSPGSFAVGNGQHSHDTQNHLHAL